MEQHEIQELITHPERLNASTMPCLKELVTRYPYFQTAWILYLKNLFILSDPTFEDELRRGALFVADLSVLFYYIEGERFLIKKHETVTREGETISSDRTLDLIDRFLSEIPEQNSSPKTVSNMTIPMEMPGDYTSVLMSEVTEEEKEASPLHGQDLIDQFIEKSASGSTDLLDEPQENEQSASVISSSNTSIEEVEEQENLAQEEENQIESSEEEPEESYFTETLAKIYVRQQRYDKALEIIKKLNLKYPKKNAYFADQIRFLEKLIINAKSK